MRFTVQVFDKEVVLVGDGKVSPELRSQGNRVELWVQVPDMLAPRAVGAFVKSEVGVEFKARQCRLFGVGQPATKDIQVREGVVLVLNSSRPLEIEAYPGTHPVTAILLGQANEQRIIEAARGNKSILYAIDVFDRVKKYDEVSPLVQELYLSIRTKL